MSELNVSRWRRYGNDRLFVKAADGSQLGWHDLKSGTTEVTDPTQADELHAAIARWLTAQPSDSSQSTAPEPGVALDAVNRLGVATPAEVEPPAAPTASPPAASVAPPFPGTSPMAAATCPDKPAPAAEPEWQDLASHRAGELAREQARALKAAAPVRTLLARALRVHTDERAWRIGADGEEKVAARLARLTKRDPRWRTLHAIEVGEKGSDIDHLVIGPGGVYTLNAKHHPGANIWVGGDAVLINGQRQPYVRNSRHEASRASRLLTAASGFPVFAAGAVVLVGARQVTIKQPPLDVLVVGRRELTRWLRRQAETLNSTTIDAIFDAARRSTTWHPAPAHPDPFHGSSRPHPLDP